jgi:predicted nicotinamide N-methyase
MSGADNVIAGDIDLNAVAAIAINAAANGTAITARAFDFTADDACGAEVILAADVFYQRELAELALRFLRDAARVRRRRLRRRPRPALPARRLARPAAPPEADRSPASAKYSRARVDASSREAGALLHRAPSFRSGPRITRNVTRRSPILTHRHG